MSEQSNSVLSDKNAFVALHDISQILNTGLSQEELKICVQLCERGINPNMLASIIRTLKQEVRNLTEKCDKDIK
ncbi:UNVERIFIED_CONTAM: hypothetical protein PYX00_008382 [Menopon gallinae]|uniref:Mitotic-spindle organizing protein 1 n=1 Tax=Menopon gallinae TaxID=328185 RepID=A0AAW2HN10_9NEOP